MGHWDGDGWCVSHVLGMDVNYAEKAKKARRAVLDMLYEAQTSHIASNFSAIDFLTVLYEHVDLEKDEVIISKGWIASSIYHFLSEKGVIPKKDLKTYCKPNSKYIGLLEPTVAGVKCAGGSMGYGLPFGVGFALAKKLRKEEGHVYVVMSDGEQAIGTTWESALIAAHHGLNNLTVIVDYNKLQAMGETRKILNIEPFGEKWSAFRWDVSSVAGHDYVALEQTLFQESMQPRLIVAHTTKGKGVPLMENNLEWHYRNVTKEVYDEALKHL